ncbi:hypothetical protein LCGC14_2619700, partial [marine sediment metagenome]
MAAGYDHVAYITVDISAFIRWCGDRLIQIGSKGEN